MKPAEYYTYTQPILVLAPGAAQTQTLTFDASSDFIWMYAAFAAFNHAANTGWTMNNSELPPITILLTPGDTSAQMMNVATPIGNIFNGNALDPFVLPNPRTFPARSTLLFACTNLDSTITYDLYLSLIGVKRFLS